MPPRRPRRRRRPHPTISVVVPVYDVEDYLPACLDSVLGQRVRADLEVIVVDDGSPDESGAIAEAYAARDPRVRVVHIENRGLGAARNEGIRHARGDLLTFLDSDDVLPPGAYAALLPYVTRGGCDFTVGSIARWEDEGLIEPRWMARLHSPGAEIAIEQRPEILGDVFAWNKLFRRDFWDAAALAWPEGVRYEDQPCTTRAYLAARRIAVIPDIVYHWRIRSDGSSITQQRGTLQDLQDRWDTKRDSWHAVQAHGSDDVSRIFHDRVLAGDLPRYFAEIPGCTDDWWTLLQAGIAEFWGERSLVHSGLTPAHRLIGWLVEQDRRDDAAAVVTYTAGLGGPLPRVADEHGRRIDVPVIDIATVDRAALALRDDER